MSKPAVRPLIAFSILQLEEAFEKARTAKDTRKIKEIARELECRSVPKAKKLLRGVSEHLDTERKAKQSRKKQLPEGTGAVAAAPSSTPVPSIAPGQQRIVTKSAAGKKIDGPADIRQEAAFDRPKEPSARAPQSRKLSSSRTSRPPSRQEPRADSPEPGQLGQRQAASVLDAWIALEVLSPPRTYEQPQDLVDRNSDAIADLAHLSDLPWRSGERGSSQTKLFYHVVLGAIRMEEATARLLDSFNHAQADRVTASGFAPIAMLTLDRDGKPVESGAIAVSSFAWGLPLALKQDFGGLGGWLQAEPILIREADTIARQASAAGDPLAVTSDVIRTLFEYLVDRLALPSDLVVESRFAIRAHHYWLAEAPPDPPPVSSHCLRDLALAKEQVEKGILPANLARYLGLKVPAHRVDLRGDHIELSDAIAPARTPLGKWPSQGSRPLALLQQAAVNLAVNGDEHARLLPVNGLSGAAKTTLLRDIVVALVVERAQAMSELSNPNDAFAHIGKVRTTSGFANHYALDDALKGFEIVVATSSDKAVEGIGIELPSIEAIDAERPELRYFKTISDNLLRKEAGVTQELSAGNEIDKPESWGVIAAALGNVSDRHRFRQKAWDDEDLGLRAYLLATAGTPQSIEIADQKKERIAQKRKPLIVDAEKPPVEGEALSRWQTAQRQFRTKAKEIRAQLDILERGRHALGEQLDPGTEEMLQAQSVSVERVSQEARLLFSQLSEATQATRQALSQADQALQDHAAGKPSFLRRLIGSNRPQEWSRARETLALEKSQLAERLRTLEAQLDVARTKCDEVAAMVTGLGLIAERVEAKRRAVAQAIDGAVAISGLRFADAAFFDRPDTELLRDSPWMSDEINRLREDLFVAAMNVHKAFVDAAAKPIRNNLDLLFKCFSGKAAWTDRIRPIMPDLWATFFCVIPVVATTLASIEGMLGYLGGETLGWLLIDEAGQAAPQQAIGALLRTKRAVVIGDPMQLPAMTGLSTVLAGKIAERFGIEGGRFMAPGASVQTLAGASSVFGATVMSDAAARPADTAAAASAAVTEKIPAATASSVKPKRAVTAAVKPLATGSNASDSPAAR
jgi:hypothetical protein